MMPRGPMPAVAKAFETISTAQVSKSAALAKEMMFLKASDGITMNRDRLLADAKAKALSLVDGYKAPEKPTFRLPAKAAAPASPASSRASARRAWRPNMTRSSRAGSRRC